MTALLTTVIGLIGVYIAFALAASWVNEQIATYLQLRSKTLIAGVCAMVGDAATADFFGHPLITSLGETSGKNIWAWLGTVTGLKYVTQRVPPVPVSTAEGTAPAARALPSKRPPYVSADHFTAVILDVLRGKANGTPSLATFSASTTEVAAAINSLSNPASPYKPLYDVLLPIWRDAEGDYERFTQGVASWYDSHMDRVSGWYKRSVQIMLAYIGLAIAFGFNVDTVQITQELQRNTALASTLAAATQAYYQANPSGDAGRGAADITTLSSMTKACPASGPCTCDAGFTPEPIAKPTVCRIDQSSLAQLPIGWTGDRWKAFRQSLVPHPNAPFHQKLVESGIWLKLFGLVITMVAILLGAPFWFDVLGAIVNVRSVGAKPPAKTT